MLSLSQPIPSACPRAGTELEKRKLKTKAMTMPEITIGITKIVRSPVLKRMREVSPTASRNATAFTTITVTAAKPKVKR